MPSETRELYSVFTLACHLFESKETQVCQDTASDQFALTGDWHYERFDRIIRSFLLNTPQHPVDQSFLAHLDSEINELQSQCPRAAEVFRQIRADFTRRFGKWDPSKCTDKKLKRAQKLARRFYKSSIWPETSARMESEDTESWRLAFMEQAISAWPTDYSDGDLLVLFDTGWMYKTFWLLAFAFMHEYCSHVYSDDNDLSWPKFTDGWLAFAAAQYFLKHELESKSPDFAWGLDKEFHKHVQRMLPEYSVQSWSEARTFYNCVLEQHPTCFWDLVYELARFEPVSRRNQSPDDLLDRLMAALAMDDELLLENIGKSKVGGRRVDARKLYDLLLAPSMPQWERDILNFAS